MRIAQQFRRFLVSALNHSSSNSQSRVMDDQFRADPSTHASKRSDPRWKRGQAAAIGGLVGEDSFNAKPFSIHVRAKIGPQRGGAKTGLGLRSMPAADVLGQRCNEQPTIIFHRIIKPARVIIAVGQHDSAGSSVTQHFARNGLLADVQRHHAPDRNSPVFRCPGVIFVPLGHSSWCHSGRSFAILGARADAHGPAINERQLGERCKPSKMRMQALQEGITAVCIDALAELRNGGELARAKATRIVPPIASPRQRSIMPNRPDVHRNNQPIGVGRATTKPRKGSIRAADRLVDYLPCVAVHSAPPCSCRTMKGVTMAATYGYMQTCKASREIFFSRGGVESMIHSSRRTNCPRCA